jgi:hypothetical protein
MWARCRLAVKRGVPRWKTNHGPGRAKGGRYAHQNDGAYAVHSVAVLHMEMLSASSGGRGSLSANQPTGSSPTLYTAVNDSVTAAPWLSFSPSSPITCSTAAPPGRRCLCSVTSMKPEHRPLPFGGLVCSLQPPGPCLPNANTITDRSLLHAKHAVLSSLRASRHSHTLTVVLRAKLSWRACETRGMW